MRDALFVVHGMTLALAWLMAVNLAATLAVIIAFRPLMAIAGVKAPGFWLGLRLFPAAARTPATSPRRSPSGAGTRS